MEGAKYWYRTNTDVQSTHISRVKTRHFVIYSTYQANHLDLTPQLAQLTSSHLPSLPNQTLEHAPKAAIPLTLTMLHIAKFLLLLLSISISPVFARRCSCTAVFGGNIAEQLSVQAKDSVPLTGVDATNQACAATLVVTEDCLGAVAQPSTSTCIKSAVCVEGRKRSGRLERVV